MNATFNIDSAMRDRALRLGLARSGSMQHRDTVNSRSMMRQQGRPDWWRHHIGALGEIVFSLYSGLTVNTWTIGRGDDGSDFPGGINVKASDCKTEPRLMILKTMWERKHAKVYVIVWINEPHAHILGGITSEEFARVHKSHDWGRGETYFVEANQLHPIEEFHFPPPASGCLSDGALSKPVIAIGSVPASINHLAPTGVPVGQRRRI